VRPQPTLVLIEPSTNDVARRFALSILAQYPPLAQIRLAGQVTSAKVEIWDVRIAGERERLLSRLRSGPPEAIGISHMFSSNGEEIVRLAADLRAASPRSRILLGGSAASAEPQSFVHSEVDLICAGVGDGDLPALMDETARAGVCPERFPGFYHREDGAFVLEPGSEPPQMASLRPSAWELLPRRYWRSYYHGPRPTGMGQTSEGCPFDCKFCSVWINHGRRHRMASLENVKHDLRSLPKMARSFFFADDNWMLGSQKQLEGLYDPLFEWVVSEFLPRRGEMRLTSETRTDLFLRQEERFRAWIQRGHMTSLFFGVESATDDQLASLSKRNTMDTNSEALRRARQAGAKVSAQFVVPCDADHAFFDEMVRFLREHRPWINLANFTVETPLPGTVLYKQALETAPELADRRKVRSPAFSLFTALMPTRLEPRDFYTQMARLYREANQITINGDVIWQLCRTAALSPWLIPNLVRIPKLTSALTNPTTFIDIHAQVTPGLPARRVPEQPPAAASGPT
jgi:magnesium-protoporphyrin IX monomethyl ester (oxidative) cyclase